MRRAIWLGVLNLLLVCLFTFSIAFSATKEEVKEFVNKAVAYCKKVGKDKCLKDFTYSSKWKKGELYIFAVDMNGVTIAHGGNPKLVGKNAFNLKDKNGKYFIREMINIAKKKGEGWVLYYWFDRVTKKVRPKISFVKKVDDTFFVGCGIYK
jgi:cytochrome c